MTESTGSGRADIRVVSPNATPEEVAAVTVVVTQALAELADELGAEAGPGVSAWQRSQRQLRSPLHPGPGAWRSFSA
ncbi:MAG: acyl-CoA carboxylase subunit epsilon [Actinobacteria bacterium]|nr:acyl-CoA carboxylase subunit epsilon [Actinomycetota bacterium]